MPVRELRAGGWRTRVADHATESALNLCTSLSDTMVHDNADMLSWIVLNIMASGKQARLWKRDVKRAFKRIPTMAAHKRCRESVWQHDGTVFFSRDCRPR